MHFIRYPKLRYRLKALRRKLLWSWQRPQRPGRLPRPKGKAPVIPLISEALNPPPEPLPGPSTGGLRFGGRYKQGWSALPEVQPVFHHRRQRLRFWYQLPENSRRRRHLDWLARQRSYDRYWRHLAKQTYIRGVRILFRHALRWRRRRPRGRRIKMPIYGWVGVAFRRKALAWVFSFDFDKWVLENMTPPKKWKALRRFLRALLAAVLAHHRRRLSRRFESQRLAAAASGRGLTWLRGGSAAGQRRPSRRPRQLTGGRRRS